AVLRSLVVVCHGRSAPYGRRRVSVSSRQRVSALATRVAVELLGRRAASAARSRPMPRDQPAAPHLSLVPILLETRLRRLDRALPTVPRVAMPATAMRATITIRPCSTGRSATLVLNDL